jgi:hypothetical protein
VSISTSGNREDLAARCEAKHGFLQRSEQGAGGHDAVTFAEALFYRDLQVRNGLADLSHDQTETGTVDRLRDERTSVAEVAALKLFS